MFNSLSALPSIPYNIMVYLAIAHIPAQKKHLVKLNTIRLCVMPKRSYLRSETKGTLSPAIPTKILVMATAV